ncbi:hypothetical protein OSC52_15335 [Clostridium pasteurianum]|uniref:hypothetical protein n=1 Tax=Clostridium pasteurianum TaxID=1501 RepID=UPI002260DA22|nr:hypothetical protein [Clostridium pasteurianum]UZW13209.1 hypothetical protein OSC52_15335 [Clostridium pasteurianum]
MDEHIIIKIPSVKEWNRTQLRYACRKNKVKGYTKMNREQLIVAVEKILEDKERGDKVEAINRENKK